MNDLNNAAQIEALISRLIDKLDSSRTDSLELEIDNIRIKLDRHTPVATNYTVPTSIQTVSHIPASDTVKPTSSVSEDAQAAASNSELETIKAPLLGVAYAASSPDAAPFVKVGQSIKKGDIICIIEAMKVMNEIEADKDGTVTDILFENGKMVEYGQPLIAVK